MKKAVFLYRPLIINLACSLLILLWVYTVASKLSNVNEFKRQLGNQTLGKDMADVLLWFIPISEISAALLLLFRQSRFAGFGLSVFLLVLFSGYIGLVLLGYYSRVPCSCGGVLKQLGWQTHFIFNLFFLALAGLGFWWSRPRQIL